MAVQSLLIKIKHFGAGPENNVDLRNNIEKDISQGFHV